jgi:hypothetical protein
VSFQAIVVGASGVARYRSGRQTCCGRITRHSTKIPALRKLPESGKCHARIIAAGVSLAVWLTPQEGAERTYCIGVSLFSLFHDDVERTHRTGHRRSSHNEIGLLRALLPWNHRLHRDETRPAEHEINLELHVWEAFFQAEDEPSHCSICTRRSSNLILYTGAERRCALSYPPRSAMQVTYHCRLNIPTS